MVTTYVSKMPLVLTRAHLPVPFVGSFAAKYAAHAMKDKSVKQEHVLPILPVSVRVLRANAILPTVAVMRVFVVKAKVVIYKIYALITMLALTHVHRRALFVARFVVSPVVFANQTKVVS